MATVSFTFDSPELDISAGLNIADADTPRLMAYLCSPASGFGMVSENVQTSVPDASWTPGEGETEADRPMIQTQAWVSRPATPEEASLAFARSVIDGLLAATLAYEKALAAQAAADGVAPIAVG